MPPHFLSRFAPCLRRSGDIGGVEKWDRDGVTKKSTMTIMNFSLMPRSISPSRPLHVNRQKGLRPTLRRRLAQTGHRCRGLPRTGMRLLCDSFFFFLYLTLGGTYVPSLPRGMGCLRRLFVLSLLNILDPA